MLNFLMIVTSDYIAPYVQEINDIVFYSMLHFNDVTVQIKGDYNQHIFFFSKV